MSTTTPPFRIVASDMDGTLLDKAHSITPYTMETLFQLSVRYGVKFIFATGRHHLSVHAARETLATYFHQRYQEYHAKALVEVAAHPSAQAAVDAAVPGFYLVTSNGARIHDPDGRLIVQHNLDPEVVRALYTQYGLPYISRHGPAVVKGPALGFSSSTPQIVSQLAHNGEAGAAGVDGSHAEDHVIVSAYTTDQWYTTAPFMSLEEVEKKFGVRPYVVPFDAADPANAARSVFDEFPVEDVGKLYFRSSDKHILDWIEQSIKRQFGDRVAVALSSPCCLDVMTSGVSKASALKEIVDSVDVQAAQRHAMPLYTMHDVISFGDSMNDEEMLAAAGKGCVMRNAQDRLKKALPQCEVILSNEENGVAAKLREVFHMPVEVSMGGAETVYSAVMLPR
ncbi:hypothetical protein ABB37_01675 [Leptomonas pyrrhocoris]|uniref:Haloacid dehalogenase-like hydrolase-like protein n=1 Tax=Leptomonas pyrrhocoris TaxID=157538 RepID=A0A0N0DZJ3_LEPPY|nr:hypothetical protein ABB37_01675 [Leptomonas pyrrhocoris]XP_015663791.1 hypothetical protein ABB37_01675 [Leptomonas pyrrhocoris]KPA85351.1 hypothetical protein ABB37_01675 [Leptomonas pyrrhocoris]KPA85352.1 hypothetical protein ABB37_01675 [Leptomonas pyrrhocoris]|eukprot:XP_015663790.1 hypothetical protein ABB37_01675 [Leptomonas pyrrhocoris]